MDYDTLSADDFTAQYAIPLSTLNEGTWQLPMYDRKNNPYKNAKKDCRLVVSLNWVPLTKDEEGIGSVDDVKNKISRGLENEENSQNDNLNVDDLVERRASSIGRLAAPVVAKNEGNV